MCPVHGHTTCVSCDSGHYLEDGVCHQDPVQTCRPAGANCYRGPLGKRWLAAGVRWTQGTFPAYPGTAVVGREVTVEGAARGAAQTVIVRAALVITGQLFLAPANNQDTPVPAPAPAKVWTKQCSSCSLAKAQWDYVGQLTLASCQQECEANYQCHTVAHGKGNMEGQCFIKVSAAASGEVQPHNSVDVWQFN